MRIFGSVLLGTTTPLRMFYIPPAGHPRIGGFPPADPWLWSHTPSRFPRHLLHHLVGPFSALVPDMLGSGRRSNWVCCPGSRRRKPVLRSSSHVAAARPWDVHMTSIQCLILISICYCCLLKPCRAHDYCLIASLKIQNLFKWWTRAFLGAVSRLMVSSGLQATGSDTLELTHRVYWAILLLER
jgi:hypothetical protein